MKTLYLIGGTMGVGKTSACRALQQLLPNSVFFRRGLVLEHPSFSGDGGDQGPGFG